MQPPVFPAHRAELIWNSSSQKKINSAVRSSKLIEIASNSNYKFYTTKRSKISSIVYSKLIIEADKNKHATSKLK